MALVEGVQYGLSSQTHLSGKKSVIFLKLTDSALRAIEDYLRIQNKTGQQATLQFLGSEGRIHIPSSHANDGHSFDFSLSSNADIEGPQGSFECIQQCGSRSLESMGTLPFKMRIHAKDDVYETTRLRMNAVEEERKKDCAKEIKQNGADIKRKVKNKFGGGVIPPPHRREDSSPIFNNQNSSHNSHHSNSSKPSLQNNSSSNRDFNKLSNGTNNHSVSPYNNKNSPGAGIPSKMPNGGSNSNLDVSKRPLKERLIHLLAVKPFKKPELMARIYRDGIKERDKKLVMLILQQVSIYKDNEYNLVRGIWNDVQEDWPFYNEQERQLMKRRKPQNLTPPGSDCSVGSGTSGSSLSPRSTTSAGSGHSPSNFGVPSLMNGSERGGGYHQHGSSVHRERDREHGGRGDNNNLSNYSSSGSHHHHVPKSNSSGGSGLLLPGTGNHYNNNATMSQGVKRPGSSNGGSILDHSGGVDFVGGNVGANGEMPAAKRQRVSHFKKPNCSNSKGENSSNYPTQQQNGHNNGNGSSANARLDNINSMNGKLDRGERDNSRDSSSLSPAAPPASLVINSMTTHQSQHQQLHRNYSERLSPIGTANNNHNNHNNNANSANHNSSSSNSSSSLTNNQTSGQAHNSSVVTNHHRSPRSVVPELINLSPSSYHSTSNAKNNNANNNSSHNRERENCSQDSEFSTSSSAYHAPWTNRSGSNSNVNSITGPPTRSNLQVHDNHLSHNSQVDGMGFKIDVDVDTKLPADSDETDSVDSGNGSSSSSSSSGSGSGSRHHNINSSNTNSSAVVANALGLNLPATMNSASSLNVNIPIVNIINGTNGCNRVSSTTNGNGFHSTTPQSSPDSQIEALQKQQLEQQQNEWKSNGGVGSGGGSGGSGGYNNYNSSSNSNSYGGANNHHHKMNGRAERGEIVSSRDKDMKYRDRDQSDSNSNSSGRGDHRGDRTRESRRDSRTKDRDRSDRDSRGDKERIDRADRKERDREREKSKDSDDNGRQIKPASEYPSYLTKYTTIVNGEQRLRYKDDFNAEYAEYRDLHSVIDKVSKKFAHLEERLRQEERGTDGYQNVKDEIVCEYYANKKNRKYQEAKQKFTYLHEKLSHIKRLVSIYDTLHSSQSGELEDANNSDCFF